MTPSVFRSSNMPNSVGKSFLRGQITTGVNDSGFQMSRPFRYAKAQVKIMEQSSQGADEIQMEFTDGGAEQRNTLESLVCCDMLIL